MANFIENSNRLPEYVESSFKTLITPTANFIGTLIALPAVTVQLLGDDNVVYGTFTLDTVGEDVKSGLLTDLPARMRFNVTSAGVGRFTIRTTITP